MPPQPYNYAGPRSRLRVIEDESERRKWTAVSCVHTAWRECLWFIRLFGVYGVYSVRHWTHEPRIGDDTRHEFASMPLLVDPVSSSFSLAFPRRRCRCDAMFRKCSRFRVENRISAESRTIRRPRKNIRYARRIEEVLPHPFLFFFSLREIFIHASSLWACIKVSHG